MAFKCFCGKMYCFKYDYKECENCYNAMLTYDDCLYCEIQNIKKKYIREHDQNYIDKFVNCRYPEKPIEYPF